LTWKHFENQGK